MPFKKIEATQKDINQSLVAVGAQLEERKIQEGAINARLNAVEQAVVSRPRGGHQSAETGSSVVAQEISASSGFKSIQSGLPTSGRMTVQQGLKAAITNPGRGQTGDKDLSQRPYRAPGILMEQPQKLTLLDVLKVIPVDSQTYEYIMLDGYVNQAGYQLKEGDLKAEAGEFKGLVKRAEVSTIAHWLPASKQVIDDDAELERAINFILSTSCAQKLEHELMNGAGGEGEITGLIPQAQAFTPTATKAADRIGEAVTDLSAKGFSADVILLHPSDWFLIASERAESGNGQYTLGSPRDPSPLTLWGAPVALSPSMTQGKALLFDREMVALLDRQAVTVELSRHDGDNFKRNMVTILAELRAGLVVFAPSATRLLDLA